MPFVWEQHSKEDCLTETQADFFAKVGSGFRGGEGFLLAANRERLSRLILQSVFIVRMVMGIIDGQ